MDTNQTPKIDRAAWLQLLAALLIWRDFDEVDLAAAARMADAAAAEVLKRYPAGSSHDADRMPARWGHVEVFGHASFDALVTSEERGGVEGLHLLAYCARRHVVLDRWYGARAIYSEDYACPDAVERRAQEAANDRCMHPDCVSARAAERKANREYELALGKLGCALATKVVREQGRIVSSSDIWGALERDQETAGRHQLPTDEEQDLLMLTSATPRAVEARLRWPELARVLDGEDADKGTAPDQDDYDDDFDSAEEG